MINTRNVDLAAYLWLNGIEPVRAEANGRHQATFYYDDRNPLVNAAMDAFERNTMVPVRSFGEARHEVKAKYGVGYAHALENHKDAVHRALRQRKFGRT